MTATCLIALTFYACDTSDIQDINTDTPTTSDTDSTPLLEAKKPTVQSAKEFIERAENELLSSKEFKNRADWVKDNFITEDTSWLAKKAGAKHSKLIADLASQAIEFSELDLPPDMKRKLDMLIRENLIPAPNDKKVAEELAALQIELENNYNRARFTHNNESLSLNDAAIIMANSRDPKELSDIWRGWRSNAAKIRGQYSQMVEIANQGAGELGFSDVGSLWRSGYDMLADEFAKETDRLWMQVKPLYTELHCHVRAKLNEHYGDEIVPLEGPIRADLLGNMWGQSWGNIYDLLTPLTPSNAANFENLNDSKSLKPNNEAGLNLAKILRDNEYDAVTMAKTAEGFFTSLGFQPLPESFWSRSLFTKPRDRDVSCQASAWNIDNTDDVRIKMCIQETASSFFTVHHELGHSYYQRAYKNQSIIYRRGANDGFHEAIGDFISLSMTPNYFANIGLIEEDDFVQNSPTDEASENTAPSLEPLMQSALSKVAFLPFGLLVDKWRWNVFNGTYSPSEYNQGWWELRETYQGLRAPVERSESDFDPGAKFHIPNNTPYMRYFLADILHFQFHKAACDMAMHEGPLHTCSIYGNKDIGRHLEAMLELGASKPWPDALDVFTGSRHMDASAMLEYYTPLMTYLKAENKNRLCGW